eukprot:9111837-Alexandrium_andersonii.AAC.1
MPPPRNNKINSCGEQSPARKAQSGEMHAETATTCGLRPTPAKEQAPCAELHVAQTKRPTQTTTQRRRAALAHTPR